MRRALAVFLLLALAVPAVAGAAAKPPLRARMAACQTGPDQADRYALATGSMPALRGTARMWMRFDLQQRRRSGLPFRYVPTAGTTLGRWERSPKGRPTGFIYTKRVTNLAAPAQYRVVVRFRWYTAKRRLQRTAKRVTGLCRQPDPRPDLRVRSLALAPAGRGLVHYRATVENVGRGASASTTAVLSIDGERRPAKAVPALSTGERTTVEFTAPRCASARPLEVRLDPADAVDEASERNNALVRDCPSRR
jgi:hypothetical protein